jgi:uncharacterized damage-inducible protein DinB
MDMPSFFLVQHGQLHAAEGGAGGSYSDRVFAGLSEEQMRARPRGGVNSLVWLLWHMARTEDASVNLVVADGRQVLDDDWARRMNVPWRSIGTGMAESDVADLTKRADIVAVWAYRSAVARRTREVVRALPPEAWEEMVGFADTARAAAAGAFAPNTAWKGGVGYTPWQGQARAAQLAGSAIRHNALHLGEAVTIRSLGGFALGV